MNSEPTHFLSFMNNGKAFPSFDGMACSYSALTNFSICQGTDTPKVIGFLESFKNPIYQKIILIILGITQNLKLKTERMEEVVVCAITNTIIKKNY